MVSLLMTLLEALSALESPSLNYLSQRISGLDDAARTQVLECDCLLEVGAINSCGFEFTSFSFPFLLVKVVALPLPPH